MSTLQKPGNEGGTEGFNFIFSIVYDEGAKIFEILQLEKIDEGECCIFTLYNEPFYI